MRSDGAEAFSSGGTASPEEASVGEEEEEAAGFPMLEGRREVVA